MLNKVTWFGILLTGLLVSSAMAGVMEKADKAAQRTQANIAVEETIPVPFDEAQAKAAMELGDANVKGVLYHRLKLRADYPGEPIGWTKANEILMPDVDVMLFPITAHLKEQRRLESENMKQRLKSKTVQLKTYKTDPRLFKYMINTKTDAQGRFYFTNLKPGHYLIQAADQVVNLTGLESVKVGESNGVYGDGYGTGTVGVTHYENRFYDIQKPLKYEFEFEIGAGQKEVKIES